jgi:integrator complex subunit 1
MLWDPDGPARKPPPEAVDMLYAINNLYQLSGIFQRCVAPDYILMSIGQTSRGAIERAYDWLIPIISSMPTTIARLPSSASCFLLLRAYSTEGEEQKQLKELSAPLLRHVQDSLRGIYGEQDAVKAFDLLMTDVASGKPNQRRCARRVLHDSLVPMQSNNPHSWMLAILELEHAKSLVACAIQHMVHFFLSLIEARSYARSNIFPAFHRLSLLNWSREACFEHL